MCELLWLPHNIHSGHKPSRKQQLYVERCWATMGKQTNIANGLQNYPKQVSDRDSHIVYIADTSRAVITKSML